MRVFQNTKPPMDPPTKIAPNADKIGCFFNASPVFAKGLLSNLLSNFPLSSPLFATVLASSVVEVVVSSVGSPSFSTVDSVV